MDLYMREAKRMGLHTTHEVAPNEKGIGKEAEGADPWSIWNASKLWFIRSTCMATFLNL